jgi:hypothetical protein
MLLHCATVLQRFYRGWRGRVAAKRRTVIALFTVDYIAATLPAAVRRCMHHNNRLFTLSGGFLGQASLTAAQLLYAIGTNCSSSSNSEGTDSLASSTQLQLQRSSTRHSAAQALVTGRGAVSVTVNLNRLGDMPVNSNVAPSPPATLTLQLLSVNGLAAAALQPAGVHYQCEAVWGPLATAVGGNGSGNGNSVDGFSAGTHTLPCAVGSSVSSRVWRDEAVCIPIAQLMAGFVNSNSTSTTIAASAAASDHSAPCLRLRVHAAMLSAAARHRMTSLQRQQQQLHGAHCATNAAATVCEYTELSRAVCSGTADKQCLAEVSLTTEDVLQMLGGPVELPLLRVSSSAAARPTSKYYCYYDLLQYGVVSA